MQDRSSFPFWQLALTLALGSHLNGVAWAQVPPPPPPAPVVAPSDAAVAPADVAPVPPAALPAGVDEDSPLATDTDDALMGDEEETPDLFISGRLFLAKAMKESSDARIFSGGIQFQFAPVKALAKQVVQQIEAQNPEARLVFDTLRQVPPEELDAMTAAASKGGTALKAYIAQAVPGLTAEQLAEVNGAIDQVDDPQLAQAAELARVAAEPESASTFLLEPYVEMNLRWISVELGLPVGGFYTDSAEFAVGNLYVDAKTGHVWGKHVGVGVTGGLEATFPTAQSERVNTLALANIFSGPKFLKNYLSLAPYLVAGVDLLVVNFQAYAKFVQLIATGDSEFGNASYLQWGAVAAFAPFRFWTLVAEMNGCTEVQDAAPFNSIYLTLGTKFLFFWIRPGVAAHVPLFQESGAAYSGFGSGTFGSPSDWSVIATLSVDI